MRRDDERFMTHALGLARAAGRTSPNPRVGAVLVRNGQVIAEGAHRGAGTPHAEAHALAGADASGATLYVTLEPCTHTGRMPPCAPVVASSGIDRVVVAMEDPDDRVAGRGIAQLRAAGLKVDVGVFAEMAAQLNAAYIHHRTTGRPLVTLKLALTIDGRMAAVDRTSQWITSGETRTRVHERRAAADAIVTGAGTVLADDPQLTARGVGAATQPLKVIVDASGRISASARVFEGDGPVIATTAAAPHEIQTAWKEAGAEVVTLPGTRGRVDLDALLRLLSERGSLDVYCEGGAELAMAFLHAGLVDRLEIHTGPRLVGGTGLGIGDLGITTMAAAIDWRLIALDRVGDDILALYERRA